MFGFLKKKKDDFDDIRSGVLGEPLDEPDFPPARGAERFDRQQPPRGFEDPIQPQRFGDRQQFDEPQGFNSIDVRERGPRGDYDVADRLNLIESQLAAIRSMTETINERLKNMESRLGYQRRY